MPTPDMIEVDVAEPKRKVTKYDDGGYAVEDEEGITISMVGDIEDELEDECECEESDWFRNLVEDIDDKDLDTIMEDLSEQITADKRSRQDWEDRAEAGIAYLGVDPIAGRSSVAENGAKVIHPMLNEACIQFAARAKAEIFPPAGPCKTRIFGDNSEQATQQARRQKEYMNYVYTVMMPEAVDEVDKMLYRVGLEGSGFKKIYYDELLGRPKTKFVSADKLLVNYEATCLEDADRITHIMSMSKSNIKKLQKSGYFCKCDLSIIEGEDNYFNDIDKKIDEVEGKAETDELEDNYHTIYECHCLYEIEADKQGEEGICYPYIVTIDIDANKILRITRNWNEEDKHCLPIQYFTHYKFIAGLGFYGLGFIHLIGDLCQTATDSIRSLLDAAYFSNMQGGFIDKTAKINQIDAGPMSRGSWYQVQYSGQEIKSAIVPLDYPEPSPTMLNLLTLIVDYGRRIASTTEAMVGDASNQGPVGTTLALIEQGSKVYSDAHRRMHDALAKELKILERVIIETTDDDETYPYVIDDSEQFEIVADFMDEKVAIIPVSDPKVFSSTQRLAKVQGVMALANQAPALYNMNNVHRMMLGAMEFDDVESAMIGKQEFEFLDPVSENVCLTSGRPIRAFIEQDHQAHIMVHQAYMQSLDESISKLIMPSMIAHMSEHYAFGYMVKMMEQGVPVPEGNLIDKTLPYLENGMNNIAEKQFSARAAIVSQKMAQEQAQKAQQMQQQALAMEAQQNEAVAMAKVSGEIKALEAKTMAEIQMNQAKTQATIEQKGVKTQTDIAFRDRKEQASLARADLNNASELERKDLNTSFDMLQKNRQAEADARLNEKKAAIEATKPAPQPAPKVESNNNAGK